MNDWIDPWVLVQPLDAKVPQPSTWEKNCQLFCIWAKPRTSSCFILAKSIICGVIIIPTYIKEGDFYIFDLLDDDISLKCKNLWKEWLGWDWIWLIKGYTPATCGSRPLLCMAVTSLKLLCFCIFCVILSFLCKVKHSISKITTYKQVPNYLIGT